MLPTAVEGVIFKPLSDGAVLFSTTDEVYFGLNPVGALVWELLPPKSRTLDELCAAVHAQYPDAEADIIRADVAELLQELTEHGLLRAPATAQG